MPTTFYWCWQHFLQSHDQCQLVAFVFNSGCWYSSRFPWFAMIIPTKCGKWMYLISIYEFNIFMICSKTKSCLYGVLIMHIRLTLHEETSVRQICNHWWKNELRKIKQFYLYDIGFVSMIHGIREKKSQIKLKINRYVYEMNNTFGDQYTQPSISTCFFAFDDVDSCSKSSLKFDSSVDWPCVPSKYAFLFLTANNLQIASWNIHGLSPLGSTPSHGSDLDENRSP